MELETLRPSMSFPDVIRKYGYPMVSKRVAEYIRLGKRNLADKIYTERLAYLGIGEEDARKLNLKMPDEDMLSRYRIAITDSKFMMKRYRPLLDVDFALSEECCNVMKKSPMKKYAKESGRYPIIGTMASESMNRASVWFRNGCNAFEGKEPSSRPLSFWTEQDVLQYITKYNLPIASVYGEIITTGQISMSPENVEYETAPSLCCTGCDRTGCTFCGFGAHIGKGETRFQKLHKTHPKLWNYCINGGAYDPADGLWKPDKAGLGMRHVFDTLNQIYGADFIRYE